MSFALEIVVANHAATNTPTILEGDGIVPAFAVQPVFANRNANNDVRAIFLIEENEFRLFNNAKTRGRGFEQIEPSHQERQIRVSWLYGQWLKEEAIQYNVPILSPYPMKTLDERIIEAIQ